MKRTCNVIIKRDAAGWYEGSVPLLHGCHSQARSQDALMQRMQEVIELCAMEQEDHAASSPDFIGVQRLAVNV